VNRIFEFQFEDPRSRRASGEHMTSEQIEGVYIISVAARILEMHPQTLRKYERVGLVNPSRTGGKLRLYSEVDIARLRLIKHLVNELGLNLAGVQLVLEVFNQLLNAKAVVRETPSGKLRAILNEKIDEIIQTLYAHQR